MGPIRRSASAQLKRRHELSCVPFLARIERVGRRSELIVRFAGCMSMWCDPARLGEMWHVMRVGGAFGSPVRGASAVHALSVTRLRQGSRGHRAGRGGAESLPAEHAAAPRRHGDAHRCVVAAALLRRRKSMRGCGQAQWAERVCAQLPRPGRLRECRRLRLRVWNADGGGGGGGGVADARRQSHGSATSEVACDALCCGCACRCAAIAFRLTQARTWGVPPALHTCRTDGSQQCSVRRSRAAEWLADRAPSSSLPK